MKVLLICGSPHEHGCTYTALSEMQTVFEAEGVESEIIWLGKDAISGCLGCGGCKGTARCVIDDIVNRIIEKAEEADGFVFGTPVHYAGASGAITSCLDRVFYAGKRGGKNPFYLKPGCVVVSARRAGTTATFDQLMKYLTISEMPVVSSRYWNMVHGNTPEEVMQDKEGLQTMRMLARNMVWLLRCKEAGAKAGVPMPEQEVYTPTNFIR